MELEAQVQLLVDHAPQDGQTPQIVTAIAPVLITFAEQLGREEYYVLQTLNGDWVRLTLASQQEQGLEKTVIYAFPSLADARTAPIPRHDPDLMAIPMPVTHILFQLMAIKTIDSLIFFSTPGNLNQGTEVHRDEFERAIQSYFQHVQDVQDGQEDAVEKSPPATWA